MFVALYIQHSMRLLRVILSCMTCPAVQYFSTSDKRHDFWGKNVIEHENYVLISSTPFVWNIFYSKKKWARYDRKHSSD